MAYLDSGGVTTLTTVYDGRYKKAGTSESATNLDGIVPVANGGTGRNELTSNAVLTGNGTNSVNMVGTASGALYATAANGAPSFGTLPIGQGGTGATSAANARTNLGAQAAITGAASSITSNNLTPNMLLVSNSSGKVAASSITTTELGYIDGVTSNIQDQLDGKMSSDTVIVSDVKITTGGVNSSDSSSVVTNGVATIPIMGPSSSSAAGTSGLVPAPSMDITADYYLNALGGWTQADDHLVTIYDTNVNDSTARHLLYPIDSSTPNALRKTAGLTYVPSTGTLTATKFVGSLQGTATSASSASSLAGTHSSGSIASGVTATTQSPGDESTKIATTKFVATAISNAIDSALSGSAMYKGSVDAGTDISNLTNYKQGWYWVVATAGTYCGQSCEVGDMIFCNTDYSSAYSASHFDVIQSNITAMTSSEIQAAVAAAS